MHALSECGWCKAAAERQASEEAAADAKAKIYFHVFFTGRERNTVFGMQEETDLV